MTGIRKFLIALGVVLVSLGLFGYTADPVFGLFSGDVAVNAFRLLIGFFALDVALTDKHIQKFSQIAGIASGIAVLVGIVFRNQTFFPLNIADTAMFFMLSLALLINVAGLPVGYIPGLRRAKIS